MFNKQKKTYRIKKQCTSFAGIPEQVFPGTSEQVFPKLT